MIAAFLHLDAAGPDNGGLFVYPGSHKLGPQEDVGARESNFHYVDQVTNICLTFSESYVCLTGLTSD